MGSLIRSAALPQTWGPVVLRTTIGVDGRCPEGWRLLAWCGERRVVVTMVDNWLDCGSLGAGGSGEVRADRLRLLGTSAI